MPLSMDRLTGAFLELVAIDSESYHESAISQHLQGIAVGLGLESFSDSAGEELGSETGNLYIRVPARGWDIPPLCLSAHMDTVTPGRGIVPLVRDGVIRSSGDTVLGADCKVGVAAILELLYMSAEGNLKHGPLEIVFSVAEEQGLRGIRYVDMNSLASRRALVLDGSGPVGCAIIASPTQDNIEFTVRGKAAHAGVEPEAGINAIQAAARAVSAMSLGRVDAGTTANIGIIEGGIAVNIVPERVTVRGEVRSLDPSSLLAQEERMVETARSACEEYGADIDIDIQRAYDGYEIRPDEPLLALAEHAAGAESISFETATTGGGSDANFLNRIGITSMVLNMGARQCHTVNEYIELSEMENLTRLIAAMLEMSGTELAE